MRGLISEARLDLDRQPMASRSRLVFARFSVGLVAVAAVVVVAVLALSATAIPPIVGWDAVAISSGSMEPLLGVGDVLVAEPYGGRSWSRGLCSYSRTPAGRALSHIGSRPSARMGR